MEDNFYHYQQKRTQILLGWGLGSAVTGLAVLLSKDKFWRQLWLQNFSWGGIDALIAWFGLRAQAKKLQQYTGKMPPVLPAEVKKDIKNFHRILLINTFLDVGYVGTGLVVWRNGQREKRPDRQGIGIGSIVQGLFLFVYDLALTLEVARRWLKRAN